ncbi:ACT domain protein [uncultured archaeon]|nr:ACT domain protein [uncultured archaeon]
MLDLKLYKRPVAAVTLTGERIRMTSGLLAEISGEISKAGVNIFVVACGEYSCAFYVDEADHAKARAAMLKACSSHHEVCVSLMKNLGMLTATGKEFVDHPGMFVGFIEPVARAGINIYSISTSVDSAIMFVDWNDARKAYAAVEKHFVKGN